MNQKTKKLTFKKETLRDLSQDEMRNVQGGAWTTITTLTTTLLLPFVVAGVTEAASCYSSCRWAC